MLKRLSGLQTEVLDFRGFQNPVSLNHCLGEGLRAVLYSGFGRLFIRKTHHKPLLTHLTRYSSEDSDHPAIVRKFICHVPHAPPRSLCPVPSLPRGSLRCQALLRKFVTINPNPWPLFSSCSFVAAMLQWPVTKAENRATAKAFHEEQERKRREEARAIAVAADLEQLDALRRYLIFHTKARVPARELIDAIDDYVEKLTGDRRTLHSQNHSIG
jgi:hypothetical protein